MTRRLSLGLVLSFALAGCDDYTTPIDVQPADHAPQHARVDATLNLIGTEPVEVIVTFDENVTTSEAVASGVVASGAGVVRFKHLPLVAALATPAQIESIRTLNGVQGIWANRQLEWHMAEAIASVGVDRVWADYGYRGTGVGIAILDSGIDGLYNPDVAYPSRTVRNIKYFATSQDIYSTSEDVPYFGFQLFADKVANSETTVGHGTHVAGIAAGDGTASGGYYTGVAPEANLIGIGAGDILFVFWILAGYDYILEHRQAANIQVVNNSWGSSGFAFDPADPINIATREAFDAGIAVVFSAGNCGPEGDGECDDSGIYQINPYSVAPWVISVAAGCKTVSPDPTNSAAHCPDLRGLGRAALLADFSSRGIAGDALHHPDITAPGVHLVSTRASTGTVMNGLDANHDATICAIAAEHVSYYTCASGTSMSAPMVTGVIALMEQASGGRLDPAEAYDILTRTADPMEGFELWEVGTGYMDAYEAVRRARRVR